MLVTVGNIPKQAFIQDSELSIRICPVCAGTVVVLGPSEWAGCKCVFIQYSK